MAPKNLALGTTTNPITTNPPWDCNATLTPSGKEYLHVKVPGTNILHSVANPSKKVELKESAMFGIENALSENGSILLQHNQGSSIKFWANPHLDPNPINLSKDIEEIQAFAFLADSPVLVSKNLIYIYNPATKTFKTISRTEPDRGYSCKLAISPNGKELAVATGFNGDSVMLQRYARSMTQV